MAAITRIPTAVGAFAVLATSYAAPHWTTHRSACAASASGVTLDFAASSLASARKTTRAISGPAA